MRKDVNLQTYFADTLTGNVDIFDKKDKLYNCGQINSHFIQNITMKLTHILEEELIVCSHCSFCIIKPGLQTIPVFSIVSLHNETGYILSSMYRVMYI